MKTKETLFHKRAFAPNRGGKGMGRSTETDRKDYVLLTANCPDKRKTGLISNISERRCIQTFIINKPIIMSMETS